MAEWVTPLRISALHQVHAISFLCHSPHRRVRTQALRRSAFTRAVLSTRGSSVGRRGAERQCGRRYAPHDTFHRSQSTFTRHDLATAMWCVQEQPMYRCTHRAVHDR